MEYNKENIYPFEVQNLSQIIHGPPPPPPAAGECGGLGVLVWLVFCL
ncbi:MAG: hypothetical protein LBG46_04110 [Elusimicrobiota bacterium]|jgi:hypothetical protein|nr:hypothetical protein [Elusimicrobiota bacterium]